MKVKVENITMAMDRILIKLYKPTHKKVKQTVLDHEKNKGKDPKNDIMETKTIEESVMYNMQTAIVLSAHPENRLGLKVDDIVIVDVRKLRDFDMYEKVFWCELYDVLANVQTPNTILKSMI